jgi:heme-degrading monooxygenase HmoA
MIRRIVKMTFRKEETATFEAIFEESKKAIRNFPGCKALELWKAKGEDTVYFTLSEWEDESALETYRNSGLFRETWAKTKVLFADKPQAWSLDFVAHTDA